jgi:hypothetical protein
VDGDDTVDTVDGGFAGGVSPALTRLESAITELAWTNNPVPLACGSDVRKTTYALCIHDLSHRSSGRFAKMAPASTIIATFSAGLGLDSSGNRVSSTFRAKHAAQLKRPRLSLSPFAQAIIPGSQDQRGGCSLAAVA